MQFGSGGIVVAEELDNGGGNNVSEELDCSTGAVTELELAMSAELAGSCSIEELEFCSGCCGMLELCEER